MAQWVGQPLKRVEDPRLLTGRGVFVADLPLKEPYAAAILRSPHAHARIRSIDTSAAMDVPGVAGVITGADVLAHTQPFAVGVERRSSITASRPTRRASSASRWRW